MTPEQFEAFEDARAETARLGWEPYMHNPSLPHLLDGVKVPTLLVWGTRDGVVPRGCIDGYENALDDAQVAEIEGVGHRPEIENRPSSCAVVRNFWRPDSRRGSHVKIGYFTERPYRWVPEEEVLQKPGFFRRLQPFFRSARRGRKTITTIWTRTATPRSWASTRWPSTSITATRSAWAA